jgi:hypothetical protein
MGNDSALIGLLLVALAGTGFWLESKDKLNPVIGIITGPNDRKTSSPASVALAIVLFVILLSVLTPKQATMITMIIVATGLARNNKIAGDYSVTNLILKGLKRTK